MRKLAWTAGILFAFYVLLGKPVWGTRFCVLSGSFMRNAELVDQISAAVRHHYAANYQKAPYFAEFGKTIDKLLEKQKICLAESGEDSCGRTMLDNLEDGKLRWQRNGEWLDIQFRGKDNQYFGISMSPPGCWFTGKSDGSSPYVEKL
jgi:hypothetical protein